jgi:hypothetical protein
MSSQASRVMANFLENDMPIQYVILTRQHLELATVTLHGDEHSSQPHDKANFLER